MISLKKNSIRTFFYRIKNYFFNNTILKAFAVRNQMFLLWRHNPAEKTTASRRKSFPSNPEGEWRHPPCWCGSRCWAIRQFPECRRRNRSVSDLKRRPETVPCCHGNFGELIDWLPSCCYAAPGDWEVAGTKVKAFKVYIGFWYCVL